MSFESAADAPSPSFAIDVTRRLGGGRIIRGTVHSASPIVALFGPSGAGKTSILNMIAGLLRPDHGRITVAGETLFDSDTGIDIRPDRRRCGYIFQEARLFPHMSVRANLRYGMPRFATSPTDLSFAQAIDLLGIGSILDRAPSTLSGGEASRVAIGRALLSRPRFFLMDEPLSSLDQARRRDILPVIRELATMTAVPILYVSHDRAEVDYLTDAVIELP